MHYVFVEGVIKPKEPRKEVKMKDISGAIQGQQKATFTVKWDGELGRGWMNIDNLKLCLFSKEHIGGKAKGMVTVEAIKDV